MSYIYALKDVKLGKFYPPTIYNNEADAKRSMVDLINYAPESMLSRHPEDFQLYLLGTYDDIAGMLGYCLDENNNPITNRYILTVSDLVNNNKADLKVVK